jgi:hypothetical protein
VGLRWICTDLGRVLGGYRGQSQSRTAVWGSSRPIAGYVLVCMVSRGVVMCDTVRISRPMSTSPDVSL